VPGRAHAELLSGRDDPRGALEAGEVVAELRVMGAQLQVLRRQAGGVICRLGGVGALTHVGDADAGERRDQRQQREGRARSTAAKAGAARGRLVERDAAQVIGRKLGT
jgi:hypothetical protein